MLSKKQAQNGSGVNRFKRTAAAATDNCRLVGAGNTGGDVGCCTPIVVAVS